MRLPLLAVVASLAFLVPRQAPVESTEPVTVVLVRHGETGAPGRDPELSEEGRARAEALAAHLAHAGVTHLFSTELARTRTTLAPLAGRVGLEVEVVSARDGARQLELLHELPAGAVAVVAGHSNTVPAMATALGTDPIELEEHPQYGPILPHDAYDRMYVITLPANDAGAPKLVELRY